jgi:hypothetical protein
VAPAESRTGMEWAGAGKIEGGANSLLPAAHHVPSFLLSDQTESVLQRDPATRGGVATGDAAREAGEVPPEVRRRSSKTSPGTAATGGTFAAGFHMVSCLLLLPYYSTG